MNETQLDTQGLRLADAYRALQLHPTASRDLIVDAYWTLVARYKRRLADGTGTGASAQLSELNASYNVLIDDERRRRFDDEYGFADSRPATIDVRRRTAGLLGLGSSVVATSDHRDYYHLLRIDREADAEMIDVAYTVQARNAIGYNIEDVFLRDLLDEAHHTLRNPQLRAQYDDSLSSNGKHHPVNGSAPVLAIVTPAPIDPAPDAESAEDDHLNGAAPAAAIAASNPQTPARKSILRRTKKSAVVVAAAHADDAPVTAQADDVNAAEHARLLTLRDPAPPPPAPKATHPDREADVAQATLEFVSGPRAGTSVSLGSEAVTLGSSYDADVMLTGDDIAAEHARVWQHGDHFVFRQIDGSGTMVGGHELTLPLVMLDDGDEIVIGPHQIRFRMIA